MKKAIIYTRTSSTKQLSDKPSTRIQKKLVSDYATKNNLKLIAMNNDRFCRKTIK